MSAEKVANLTGEILKGLLPDAVMKRDSVTDMDACRTAGVYLVTPENGTTNYPPGAYKYGLLLVFAGPYYCLQIYIPNRAGESLYLRMYDTGAGWRAWNTIAMSALA